MGRKTVFSLRVTYLLILVMLLMIALAGRLFWIQIVWGNELCKQAEEFRTRSLILNPRRGDIYDRNGNQIVVSIPAFSVYVLPNKIGDFQEFAKKISPVLKMSADEIGQKVSQQRTFVWLKHKIDPETADVLKSLTLEGIGLVEGSRRIYKQGGMAAHLLGFIGDDNQGITGLEKSYDQELYGFPGSLLVESDAAGQPLPQGLKRVNVSSPGNSLLLTIDQTIQYFTERELDKIVAEEQPSQACIIVMEPQTGEILAMSSRPSFDPERWQQVEQVVWEKNIATLYNYEPGSTFKVFVAAAALEEEVVKATDRFFDPGYILVGGQKIYCWEKKGHQAQSFTQAMQNSCNPVFVELGLKLGKERLFDYVKNFGFGRPTGIDLPGEEAGILAPVEEVRNLDVASMCIGQSISVTPLQMLNGFCAIANGGSLMKPHLVKEILDPLNRTIRQVEPQVVRRVISEKTASELSLILEKVVLEGTGKRAQVEGYRVAGKTGTAEIPGSGGYIEGKYIASFLGFAPVNAPRVAALVLLVEPKGKEYHGGEVAAPVFKNLIADILGYLNIPENSPRQQEKESEQLPSSPVIYTPNVKGYPLEDAQWFLESLGLNPECSAGEGIVEEQEPLAGSQIKRGSTVFLRVSSILGPGEHYEVVVPDLTGLPVKRAGSICETLGLPFSIKGSGLVKTQEPLPGTRAKRGTPVNLILE